MSAATQKHRPVAIGAIGGSGTRIIAQLLREIGCFMGGDLNEANDNLWFALLFNHRSVLLEPRARFERLAGLFYDRMSGRPQLDENTRNLLSTIASRPNPQHNPQWLRQRAASFLDYPAPAAAPVSWGWETPIVHVTVDRFLEFDAGLRYIHVMRNGLDMAFSENQNQLRLWGPVFLGRDIL